MSSAAPTQIPTSQARPRHDFAPAAYRMSIGDHLEELRRRLFFGIGGFLLVAVAFTLIGDHVLLFFCKPLFSALLKKNLNAQIYYTQLTEGFMVWFRVVLICAAAVSAP